MRLVHDRLESVPFKKARWTGKKITPEIVVLHDTASRLVEGRAASYLLDNDAKVSVHFVIERSGKIVQQVPTNRRANHAGQSHYHGRDYCNGFSIGIEIVNPGRMTLGTEGWARAWYGEEFGLKDYSIQEMTTPEHGHGFWMPYPEAQLDAVTEVLQALFGKIENLQDIVSHWYISPGRKIDTNPLFPLDHIRALILGREDPAQEIADAMSGAYGREGDFVQIDVEGSDLNLRRWPSFNQNIIGQIPDGTVVPMLRRGEFAERNWIKVLYAGQEGWIVEKYTAAILFRTPKTQPKSVARP